MMFKYEMKTTLTRGLYIAHSRYTVRIQLLCFFLEDSSRVGTSDTGGVSSLAYFVQAGVLPVSPDSRL